MNLRQLTYFIAIVEQGSFLKAAKVLRIAQPALSQHIANLEDELGTHLLIRTPRGITPTSSGEVLLAHARKISAQFRQARDDVRLEANTPKGEVALALPPMLSGHLAPRLIMDLDKKYPQIQLRLMEARSLDGYTLVESGRVDLGLIASSKTTPPTHLHSFQLYREPLFYVTKKQKKNQHLHMEPISFRELARKPLALSQEQHAMRSILEEVSESKKQPLHIKLEHESSALLRSYIRYGVADSVMPWPSIQGMCKAEEVITRPIVRPDIRRTVFLLWPKNYPLSPAAVIVKQMLINEVSNLIEEGVITGETTVATEDA
ncbi:LysR family transcriptional regulator [Endozoicomonadaceae bacterium StTr2]